MMKRKLILSAVLMIVFGAYSNGPNYASKETKEVIQKMIKAHGGMKNWSSTNTFSYDNVMFSESLGDQPFWVSKVTVDQKTRRVYQDWPLHNSSMVYDGDKTWSVNWNIGNPPKFEALFFYYFLNLPWLTQDENVALGEVVKTKHKAFKNEVFVIEMGFSEKPAVGKTQIDNYTLYIDSETYLLVGYEYMIGYGHMLDLFGFPMDKKLFGPMFRINDSFVEVDGLTYPNRMHTGNTELTQIYGHHAVFNYKLSTSFDELRMIKPKEALLDQSSDKRAINN